MTRKVKMLFIIAVVLKILKVATSRGTQFSFEAKHWNCLKNIIKVRKFVYKIHLLE